MVERAFAAKYKAQRGRRREGAERRRGRERGGGTEPGAPGLGALLAVLTALLGVLDVLRGGLRGVPRLRLPGGQRLAGHFSVEKREASPLRAPIRLRRLTRDGDYDSNT